MNLGVERYKLGDILIDGNQAYLICMADMADYICAELKKVRHTSVYCEVEAGLPEELTEPKTERKEGSVASVRLDAVLSLAFKSSRSKMVPLIEGSQVFINGKLVTSPSASLKEDDLVTVRHMGKFRYVGVQNQTKKGRLYVAVAAIAAAGLGWSAAGFATDCSAGAGIGTGCMFWWRPSKPCTCRHPFRNRCRSAR